MKRFSSMLLATVFALTAAQVRAEVDWKKEDAEVLKHFQTLVRMDTADPPGSEQATADYLVKTLKDGPATTRYPHEREIPTPRARGVITLYEETARR